jgi:hypothetical protein
MKDKKDPKEKKKVVKKEEATKTVGRKSLYDPAMNPQVKEWSKQGLIDTEIAKLLGIGKSTFYEWQNKHPEFSDALKEGKQIADMEVEQELWGKCHGQMIIERKEKVLRDGTIVTVQEERFVPASDTAIIFWLKNRKPEMWREKQQIEHSGSMDISVSVSHLTDDELEKELKALQSLGEENDK